jgi:hypothetical protein
MIVAAKQINKKVWVYNEKGNILFNRYGELMGYTSNTISIKNDTGVIIVYDDKGNILFRR